MSTKGRRRAHVWVAVFFAIQIPVAVALQILMPKLFEVVWQQYLIFLSIYAIVSTHLSGASAETPMEE